MTKTEIVLPNVVVAPRTDPIYNCHSYLTKVPVGAIEPFIEACSSPGDIVVDFFAGSGMTGLAALRKGRRALLSDISVLGKHISEGYCTHVPETEFRTVAADVIKQAKLAIGDLYFTQRLEDKEKIEIKRTIWSFVYVCPECSFEMIYYNQVADGSSKPDNCPECNAPFSKTKWKRNNDIPVAVALTGCNRKLTEQPITKIDLANIEKAAQDTRIDDIPSFQITEDREMYSRSGLGKVGMTETRLFFSHRNAIALLELWKAIKGVKEDNVRKKLLFAFTSILARASKRYQWSANRPLNAQNQTYYIAPVYYEWNVFDLFNRKISAIIKADSFLSDELPLFSSQNKTEINYKLSSAADLAHIEDESVDYIFTDPPFGSNIFYSDMNLFHEAWLGKSTDYSSEAVIHTTGKRKAVSGERYEAILRRAFGEAYRILKPGKYISIVFGNSKGNIWSMVQRAIREAGFSESAVHVAILDKGQRSVKGLNSGSEKVVTVDLILTLKKTAISIKSEQAVELTIDELENFVEINIDKCLNNDNQNPSYVYGCLLREAIQENMALDNLHLSDVLLTLKSKGYSIDKKSGKIISPESSK